MAKVMLSINDELLRQIDEDAEAHFQTRSGLVQSVMSQYLMGQQGIKVLQALRNEDIDEDTEKKIDLLVSLMKK